MAYINPSRVINMKIKKYVNKYEQLITKQLHKYVNITQFRHRTAVDNITYNITNYNVTKCNYTRYVDE